MKVTIEQMIPGAYVEHGNFVLELEVLGEGSHQRNRLIRQAICAVLDQMDEIEQRFYPDEVKKRWMEENVEKAKKTNEG